MNLKSLKRLAIRLAIVGFILSLTLTGAIWYIAGRLSAPNNIKIGFLPADLIGREIEFSSLSGSTIKGWLLPGKQGAGIVILMHGVRASRLSMLSRAGFLNRAGYSVLLFDFQAHGESAGEQITFGYLESRDAAAAVEFVNRTVPGEKIAVIGVSMGGAATLLASPPLAVDVIVLESVYPTIDQAITDRLRIRIGSLATIIAPLFQWQLRPRFGIDREFLRPIEKAGRIKIPKLFITGTEDRHTTLAESQQLFNAAGEPKEFWAIKDAKHVDLHQFAKSEYEQRILELFGRHLR